jgi:BirA family biotin operon repressor/biotin-[acetyl-CoA-carboxylase] ligase
MTVYWKEETDSTNLDARAGKPGDVFVADFQRAGRGRLDHVWLAAKGANLTFSAVLATAGREAADVATLPLVVGLAVVRAATALLPEAADTVRLKWPNDVLIAGRKLAGILCERDGEQIIAGIGLNVNQTDFPPEIAARATSLAVSAGRPFRREEVLARVLDELDACHARWCESGFAALHPELTAIDALKGRTVSIRQTDTDTTPVVGRCGGIRADGTLDVGGRAVYAGEAHVEGYRG